jgi:LAO/AO transport system kinase
MTVPVAAEPVSATLWIPPIQRTVSTEGKGIPELTESIGRHVAHLRQSGDWTNRERARLEVELEALIREELWSRFIDRSESQAYEKALDEIIQRKISPWEAMQQLVNGRSK